MLYHLQHPRKNYVNAINIIRYTGKIQLILPVNNLTFRKPIFGRKRNKKKQKSDDTASEYCTAERKNKTFFWGAEQAVYEIDSLPATVECFLLINRLFALY